MILTKLHDHNLNQKVMSLIDKLKQNNCLERFEYQYILDNIDREAFVYLSKQSREVTNASYGKFVYMRGLIEFSNYCKQDCNYCGIRASNSKAKRYRLNKAQILECCDEGYRLGYRTFVLQGGEDPHFTREVLVDLIRTIKAKYPKTALTLSLGERSYEDYAAFYEAGANRYLLRHETASKRLYEYLHPSAMSFENRMECLHNLKKIGFQVGAGFMVNTPTQTNADLVEDLLFLQEFKPAMCGIGPYLSHDDTPLNNQNNGTVDQTIVLVSLVRLMHPNCLLPSTTALGTLESIGREKALKAGANVVMPNLSPTNVRELYEIYQDKICTGDEAAHCRNCIEAKINTIGLIVDMQRGDTLMEEY